MIKLIPLGTCNTNTKNKFSTNNPISSFLVNKTLSIPHSKQCKETGHRQYRAVYICICIIILYQTITNYNKPNYVKPYQTND